MIIKKFIREMNFIKQVTEKLNLLEMKERIELLSK